ncbi:MAG TPA: tetratricopeptide repeat protein [Candidatus Dormibacteraeota bacterium]|nr:tetratricopeptide repeat protein [Candidatus Dormibacteraeota bacterium]
MTTRPSGFGRFLSFLTTIVWLSFFLVGTALQGQDRPRKDLPTLKKELAEAETSKGKDHADLIPILDEISNSYREQGGYVPALPFTQRALEIARKVHAREQDSVDVAIQLDYQGTLYHLQGDDKSAMESYGQALPIVEKKLGADHPAYASLLTNVAIACLASGNTGEAERSLQKALGVVNTAFGAAAQEATDVQGALGELYLRTGHFAKAEQYLVYAYTVRSEGLDIPLAAGQTTEPEVLFYMAPVRNLLGRLYTVVGLYDKADPLLHDALKAYEAKLGKDHPQLEDVLVNLAALSQAMGHLDQAEAYQKRVDQIYDKNKGLSFTAASPRPKAIEASLPVANAVSLYPDAHVGDWVVYEGPGGIPVSKLELIRKTTLIAVVRNYSWDPGKKEWQAGIEQIADLSGGVKDVYGISESDLKTEKTTIHQSEVPCSTATAAMEGRQCKIYLAPKTVPVGGLLKVECDGQVDMQASDYGRGK